MDRQELKTAAITALGTANRAMTKASIFGGKAMRLATTAETKVRERLPRVSRASERSRAQEAIHSPAFWAFGGSLAAGAIATLKPVREQIITTAKQMPDIARQTQSKVSDFISGRTPETRDYQDYGPPAHQAAPDGPAIRRETDEARETQPSATNAQAGEGTTPSPEQL